MVRKRDHYLFFNPMPVMPEKSAETKFPFLAMAGLAGISYFSRAALQPQESKMDPKPDFGYDSYKGTGKLTDKVWQPSLLSASCDQKLQGRALFLGWV